jgi:hypothetical protein
LKVPSIPITDIVANPAPTANHRPRSKMGKFVFAEMGNLYSIPHPSV